MTFADLKDLLEEGFGRGDLTHNYTRWINRALRKIQDDHDWSFMRQILTVTIDAGTTTEALAAGFKGLSTERYPIYIPANAGGGPYPCDIVSREHALNLKAAAWPSQTSTTAVRAGLPVFLQCDDTDAWSLNVVDAPSSNLVFSVSAYVYLSDLAADDDTNPITVRYEDMIEAKIKQVAFTWTNDPIAGDFEALYQKFLREAKANDHGRYYQGRVFRMGG